MSSNNLLRQDYRDAMIVIVGAMMLESCSCMLWIALSVLFCRVVFPAYSTDTLVTSVISLALSDRSYA